MIYIGNYKMDIPSKEYIEDYAKIEKGNNMLGLALPYVYLDRFSPLLKDNNVLVGAQNVTNATVKESTGEISAEMLLDVGCNFAIVGHSERRRDKSETVSRIKEKCEQALSKNLCVVLCVGETREEYENCNTSKVLEKQLKDVLNSKMINENNMIIAYEPVWAIGTGLIPTIDEVEIVIRHIKSMIERWAKCNIKVLYGGSCKPNNAKLLKSAQGLDGLLIGGACKNVVEMQSIINA